MCIKTSVHKEQFAVTYFHYLRSVAQLGRASALGAGGRTFESCHSDHFQRCFLMTTITYKSTYFFKKPSRLQILKSSWARRTNGPRRPTHIILGKPESRFRCRYYRKLNESELWRMDFYKARDLQLGRFKKKNARKVLKVKKYL